MNYRLAATAKAPAQGVDVKAALRHLKAKGNQVDFALVEGAEHGLPGQNIGRVFEQGRSSPG